MVIQATSTYSCYVTSSDKRIERNTDVVLKSDFVVWFIAPLSHKFLPVVSWRLHFPLACYQSQHLGCLPFLFKALSQKSQECRGCLCQTPAFGHLAGLTQCLREISTDDNVGSDSGQVMSKAAAPKKQSAKLPPAPLLVNYGTCNNSLSDCYFQVII